jgi:hypothetical protein
MVLGIEIEWLQRQRLSLPPSSRFRILIAMLLGRSVEEEMIASGKKKGSGTRAGRTHIKS